ncbi:MAG: hypothetical protein JSU77_02420 [Fidelibacterota bacterium]|nr:MAG: hypothetical protein JSU77_02420 [Candidatus Neomarinimicrobiota bacterium]
MSRHTRTKHITIKTYPHRHEADFDKAFLESKGIRVIMQGDDLSGTAPGRAFGGQGVRLLVPKNQAEQAQELLKKAVKAARRKSAGKKSSKQEQEPKQDS